MQRRISLALALVGAVAAAGCKGGANPSSSGSGRGVPGSTFTVKVRGEKAYFDPLTSTTLMLPDGGLITAAGGISCGYQGTTAFTACSADFPWGTTAAPTIVDVIATPYAAGGYGFHAFAGSCSGNAGCTVTGNADRLVLVRFAKTRVELGGHPNISDGTIHGPMYLARATNGLDCYSCHGASLQGQSIAVSCGMCHELVTVDGMVVPGALKVAPPAAQPTIAFSPPAPLTGTIGQPVLLSAVATDPGGAAVTCTWSMVSKPATSTVTLATSGTCSGTPGTASFTPDVDGSYQVRVAPSNQTATRDATILVVAQAAAGGAVTVGTTTAGVELTEIANRLHAVLSKGWNNQSPANVAKSLAGVDATNTRAKYAIVDVRLAEDYARGHIPGAFNVPLAQWPDVLLANPSFPETGTPTKQLIVAGYNAGDSTMGAYLANNARWTGDNNTGTVAFPAYALQYGMSGWTFDRQASPTRFDDDANVRRYPAGTTEANAVLTTPTYPYTEIAAFTGTSSTNQKILVRARAYLQTLVDEAAATGVPAREAMWTTFVKLVALRNDGDASNDPQMLDVRAAANYTTGHVPGAMFIPYQQVARLVATNVALPQTLGGAAISTTVTPAQPTTTLIDPTRKVFVQCVTGHTGGHATMALGILGYQARNVVYGMNGWTESTAVGGGMMVNFDASASGNDFPLVSSTACNLLDGTTGTGTAMTFNNAACQAAFTPSRSGCVGCHRNYLAHFSEVTVKPIPGTVVEVASEGEG